VFNMLTTFLTSEFKKWTRDPLMSFMLIYPALFALIGRYGLPAIAEASGFVLANVADIAMVVLLLFTPPMFGAIVGFSILDDRDDRILDSIQVTPLSVHQYLSIRIILAILMSFAACMLMIWFTGLVEMNLTQMLMVSFLMALGSPIIGVLINAVASNKIEGFAVMKGSGMISLFPLLGLFFYDIKEMIFGLAPGFWPAKMVGVIFRGEGIHYLSYNQYFLIGMVYVIALNILVYGIFRKKLGL